VTDFQLDPPILARLAREHERLCNEKGCAGIGPTYWEEDEVIENALTHLTATERDALVRELFASALDLLHALRQVSSE
jgi:hypothetical protein